MKHLNILLNPKLNWLELELLIYKKGLILITKIKDETEGFS